MVRFNWVERDTSFTDTEIYFQVFPHWWIGFALVPALKRYTQEITWRSLFRSAQRNTWHISVTRLDGDPTMILLRSVWTLTLFQPFLCSCCKTSLDFSDQFENSHNCMTSHSIQAFAEYCVKCFVSTLVWVFCLISFALDMITYITSLYFPFEVWHSLKQIRVKARCIPSNFTPHMLALKYLFKRYFSISSRF